MAKRRRTRQRGNREAGSSEPARTGIALRRVFGGVIVLVAGAVAVVLLLRTAGDGRLSREQRESTPSVNVLLITLDTTRADRLGCYGYQAAETPAIDALAARGVRFAHAVSPVPLTLPAHASLLTGLHPTRTGLHINNQGALGRDVRTIAHWFRQRGYRTGAFIASRVLDSEFGLGRGFDHYDDHLGTRPTRTSRPRERPAEIAPAA